MSKYQFTDTDLAAQRLKYLADVYAESTRDFILDAVNYRPRLVLDLGCGPGYTTHLLADLTQCSQIVGLDNSKRFISLAERNKTDQVSFRLHDITSVYLRVSLCEHPDISADIKDFHRALYIVYVWRLGHEAEIAQCN